MHATLSSGQASPRIAIVASHVNFVQQGAATHVYAAISPELEQHSGAYLSDCKISQPAKSAQDMTMAARLWDVTEQQIAAQQT